MTGRDIMKTVLRGVIELCDWVYSAFFVALASLLVDAFTPSDETHFCGQPLMMFLLFTGMCAVPAALLAVRTLYRRRRIPRDRPLRLLLTAKLALLILALVPAVTFGGWAWGLLLWWDVMRG